MNHLLLQLIRSEKVKDKSFYLWRRGEYHYRIEITERGQQEEEIDLVDTVYEDAMEMFDRILSDNTGRFYIST